MRPAVGMFSWAAAAASSVALSCGPRESPGRPPVFGRPASFAPECAGAVLSSEAPDPSALTYPVQVMRSASGWTATLAHGAMHFEDGWAERAPDRDDGSLSAFCRWAREAARARAAREVDGVCIVGVDHGEWGGWLETIEPGTPPRVHAIARGNVKRIFPGGADGRSVVALEGLSPAIAGSLLRLARTDEGNWCVAQRVNLGGDPAGWQVDDAGRVALLLVNGSLPSAGSLSRGGPESHERFFVVRVGDEGQLVPVE